MENLSLLLFISITGPLAMIFFVADGKAKRIMFFLLAGILACLFCGEVNTVVYNLLPLSLKYFTINVSPLIEESVKAVPILLYLFIYDPDRSNLLEASIATGVGFAVLENAFIMAQNSFDLTIWLALARGFGSGMMHGITSLLFGLGMSFVHTKKKLFYPGTVALLSFAAIYHGIYNDIVQSAYQPAGILLPLLSFVPLIIVLRRKGILK